MLLGLREELPALVDRVLLDGAGDAEEQSGHEAGHHVALPGAVHATGRERTDHVVEGVILAAQPVGRVRSHGEGGSNPDERTGEVYVATKRRNDTLRFGNHQHLDGGPAQAGGHRVLVGGHHLPEQVGTLRAVVVVCFDQTHFAV
uniref:(northern house mosquito) hypothetical protein n=1 Tax=Culex pipiens TaxID=7175 RepID=A0A8D8I5I1_CULPI